MTRPGMLLILLLLLAAHCPAEEPDPPRLQIPPSGWKLDRLADLKLLAIRLNVATEELRLLVEFTEDMPSYEVLDVRRKLNQEPITVIPYTLAFLNQDRRVRSVSIGVIRDEMSGRKGDRFEIPFRVTKELIDFRPVEAIFRAP